MRRACVKNTHSESRSAMGKGHEMKPKTGVMGETSSLGCNTDGNEGYPSVVYTR